MPRIDASASATIPAPASLLYDIIADYNVGHPSILPPKYFGRLEVLAGGRGTGTRIRFEMKAFGGTNVSVGEITEPIPGKELRETLSDGIVSTFIVDPVNAGSARVTISTVYEKGGLRGWIESMLAPRFLRDVYTAELTQLERVALDRQRAG
jgi:Polyketide cyclase / dehydrase and lipid transport.